MKPRYVLAPEAARDLAEIWTYLKQQASGETADRVEFAIRDRIALLSENPGAGHWRRDSARSLSGKKSPALRRGFHLVPSVRSDSRGGCPYVV